MQAEPPTLDQLLENIRNLLKKKNENEDLNILLESSPHIEKIFATLQHEDDSDDILKESNIRENTKVKKLVDHDALTVLSQLFFKLFPQELTTLLTTPNTTEEISSSKKESHGKEEDKESKETSKETITFLRILKIIQYTILYQSLSSASKIKLEEDAIKKILQYSNILILFILHSSSFSSFESFSNINFHSMINKTIISRIAIHIQGYLLRASIDPIYKEQIFKNFIYALHETSDLEKQKNKEDLDLDLELENAVKQSIIKEMINAVTAEDASNLSNLSNLSITISICFKYIENILYVSSDSSIRELISVFLARVINLFSFLDKGNKNNTGDEIISQLRHRISNALKLWLKGRFAFGDSFSISKEEATTTSSPSSSPSSTSSTSLSMSKVNTLEDMKKLTRSYLAAISTLYCILMANLELGFEIFINETLTHVLDMFDDFNVRSPIEQSSVAIEKERSEKLKDQRRNEVKTILSLSFALCAAHQKFQAIIRGDNKNNQATPTSTDAPEVLDDLLDLLDISFSGDNNNIVFNEKEMNINTIKNQAIYVSIISKLISSGKPPTPPSQSASQSTSESSSRQRSYDLSRHVAQTPAFLQFIFSIMESNAFKDSSKTKSSNSNTKEIDNKDKLSILEMNIESLSFLSLIPSVRESIFNQKLTTTSQSGKKVEGKLLISSLLDFSKNADPSLRYGILNIIHNVTKYVPKKGQVEEMQEQLQKFASGEMMNDPGIKEKLKKGANLDKEETEEYVNKRVLSLVSTGATSLLVSYFKLLSSSLPSDRSKYLSDIRMKAMIAEILVDLATLPKTRGKLVQDGAVKCLLTIYFQCSNKNSNSNKHPDDQKLENRVANLCSHSLAKIAISVDPNIAFRDSATSLIDPLVNLLSTSATPNAQYEQIFEGIGISIDYISQLQHFESLLALTNLASMGEESINVLLKSNNKKTLDIIESSQLSNNEMIQRAASELMCNLVMHEDVASEYLEQNGKSERRFKIWGALSGSDDVSTCIAASGALAILSADPKICQNMLFYLDSGNTGIVGLCQELFSNSDARVQHRTIEIIKNMLVHNSIPSATKTKLKSLEKYLIAVARNSQYPIQPARETALLCLQILNKL